MSKHIIGDSDVANRAIIGGADDQWANSFGDVLLNVLSGGVTGAITVHNNGGDADSVMRHVLTGGMSFTADETGISKGFKTKTQRESDAWNQKNPYTLFPLPANPTCRNMTDLKNRLILEQASAQYTYTGKIIKYIQEIDKALSDNNCKKALEDETAANQQNRLLSAAQAALGVNTKSSASSGSGMGLSPLSIALIVGGVMMTAVLIVALKPAS